jgi:hypothetical protein
MKIGTILVGKGVIHTRELGPDGPGSQQHNTDKRQSEHRANQPPNPALSAGRAPARVPSLKRHDQAATTFTLNQPALHWARNVAQQCPPLACQRWRHGFVVLGFVVLGFVVLLSFGGGWCCLLGDADLGTSASRDPCSKTSLQQDTSASRHARISVL